METNKTQQILNFLADLIAMLMVVEGYASGSDCTKRCAHIIKNLIREQLADLSQEEIEDCEEENPWLIAEAYKVIRA